ncbi:MAG TPA: flavin reductase family protein [Acidobacteriota bacterium]
MTEPPRPGFDSFELRAALGSFATGVTIVTTVDAEGQPRGLTANAFCSVSLEPPLLLVCIGKGADSHRHVPSAGRFAVSVLSDSQEHISRRLATTDADKFHGVPLLRSRSGLPLIDGALAHFECRLVQAHEGGDHTIYIGAIERFEIHGGKPLLFFGGRYHRLDPKTGPGPIP